MSILEAYRYVAAMSTLDKRLILSDRAEVGHRMACKAKGVVWHDRYLCGDAERGRGWR